MVPKAILGLVGVTDREMSVAGVTASIVEAETFPHAAVIVVDPGAMEVATPVEPAALLTAAMLVDEELHVTTFVRSCVVLSE